MSLNFIQVTTGFIHPIRDYFYFIVLTDFFLQFSTLFYLVKELMNFKN